MRKQIVLLCLQATLLLSLVFSTAAVRAQEEPFIGEVRWFAGNFAPRGWALCDGQLLAINQYSALFSILGTSYGGDGRTNFALPDMRGRGMVHEGSGPGLTTRNLGSKGGTEAVTLTPAELPLHTHTLGGSSGGGNSVMPNDRVVSQVGRLKVYGDTAGVDMGASSIPAVAAEAHNEMQPYIALNCIIALQGIFPSRS